MARFIIDGHRQLSGTLKASGNKNAALPMLAACLLTDQTITLRNVPDIQDVRVMLELLEHLGVDVSQRGGTVTMCAAGVLRRDLDDELCRRVRSSVLLSGPLAARHGQALFSFPGGDPIGRRRLDTHLLALQSLGFEVKSGSNFSITRKQTRGTSILLEEASVTATENTMMAAALTPGKTVIFNAACEPHVYDLGLLLQKMGASLEGLGTNRIIIKGRSRLNGAKHTVGPDYVEIGSYLAAAAATRGELTITGIQNTASWLPVVERGFRKLGLRWQHDGAKLTMPRQNRRNIQNEFPGTIPTIDDGIWPGFPSDLMSIGIVLATQTEGTMLFFEKLFESRMYFVDRLIQMGAQIVQCDPHRVLVVGPSELHPSKIASPDIRAGMALIIAALCAKGQTIIENAHVIDRGYERIVEKLSAIGADISRVD